MPTQCEIGFRLLLSLVFLALVVPWCRAALRAGIAGTLLDRREGLLVAISLRLLLAVSVVGIIAYVADPEAMQWSRVPMPVLMRLFGALLAVLALALFRSALQALGPGFSPGPRVKRGSALVDGAVSAGSASDVRCIQVSWTGYGLLCELGHRRDGRSPKSSSCSSVRRERKPC
jgi:hypothetical protein